MTIAIGLLLPSNELIVAADTQETFPSAKMEGQKILALNDQRAEPLGCVAFTGAGDASYLDSLGQKILGVFLDRTDISKPRDLGSAFEAEVGRFYRDHVLPFGDTRVDNEQLAVSTIIAYQRGGNRGLFRTSLSALKEYDHAAVGSGALHALTVMDPLRRRAMTTESALRLAALAVYRAKERDPFCGKQTHLALLRSNRFHVVASDVIKRWENVFSEMDQHEIAATGLGLGIFHSTPDQLKGLVDMLDTMYSRFEPSAVPEQG